MLRCIDCNESVQVFSKFALNYLNLNIDIYKRHEFISRGLGSHQPRISIVVHDNGLSSVVLPVNVLKERLTKMNI